MMEVVSTDKSMGCSLPKRKGAARMTGMSLILLVIASPCLSVKSQGYLDRGRYHEKLQNIIAAGASDGVNLRLNDDMHSVVD